MCDPFVFKHEEHQMHLPQVSGDCGHLTLTPATEKILIVSFEKASTIIKNMIVLSFIQKRILLRIGRYFFLNST